MKKTTKLAKIIVYIIIAILFIVFIYLLATKNKTKFYKDESITGNTSCNLLNGGLFCESGDKIYFSNPDDKGKLYSMNSDLSNVKKLYDDNASYINSAEKYIFYTRRNDKMENDANALLSLNTTGLFRISTSGSNAVRLYDDPTQVACLYGNNVYYQHYDQKKGLLLYTAKIDGSEDKQLLEEAAAPYVVFNNRIYYTGWSNDHSIHSLAINGTDNSIIYEGNCTALSKSGDYLYFLDMKNNYSLCRIAFDGGSPETIINQRLATYNVSADGNTVFYQVDDETNNGLYSLDLSTNATTEIRKGDYNYLHITSKYMFFEAYDQSELYTYNLENGNVEIFSPGKDD